MIQNCEHNIVLEIYTDDTCLKRSHYRCVNCGGTQKQKFGKKILSQLRHKMLNSLE